MEMVCYRLWKCLTVYGNSVIHYTTTVSYSVYNSVLHYMTTVSYSLRQECLTVYQQCLTVYGNDM